MDSHFGVWGIPTHGPANLLHLDPELLGHPVKHLRKEIQDADGVDEGVVELARSNVRCPVRSFRRVGKLNKPRLMKQVLVEN